MKYLFVILSISTILSASTVELLPVDKEIIKNSFNENFDQAINQAEEQIRLNPYSPKYYYYQINAKVLQYSERIMALDHDKREEGREKINEELITYFEDIADKFEDNDLTTEDKFYYGAILGYLARMQGIDGSWWGAFSSGKEARNVMEEIIEKDPEFYDAYLLLGMTEYYADRLSGFVGIVASALGFSGDREKGLAYLNLAYDKGNLVFGQTALTLIEIYGRLEDNEHKSLKYFEGFLKHYPRNKRITNHYCHQLINTWNFKKVDSIIQNDENNIVENYVKARYYSGRGNSEAAVEYATKSLNEEKYTWRGVNNHARYLVVYNNWLMDKDDDVEKTKELLNDRYIDIFKTTVDNAETTRWLHELSILMANNKPVNVIEEYLNSKPKFSDTLDYNNQYNLLVGSYYLRNGKHAECEEYFNEVVQSNDERARYSAYKYLIDLYLQQETSKQKVDKLLAMIDVFDNDRLIYRSRDLKNKYSL